MSGVSALLESIDPTTGSWLERKRFDVPDLQHFSAALKLGAIGLNCEYVLDPEDITNIERTYGVGFDDKSLAVTMVVDRGIQDRRYDEQVSHTGRELLLMLAGKKPFAHFSRIDRPEEDGIVPEAYFEPHVRSGRIVRQDELVGTTSFGTMRRIYYAVAGQEWRIEAFVALCRLAEQHGWNDGFEKMESYLLGYETEIDPFVRER